MLFQCTCCGGSFWQPRREGLRAVEAEADLLISAGRGDEALALARDAVRRANAS